MIRAPLVVAALMLQAPGAGWVQVIPGQPVYANPDSIRSIGPSTYRVVIFRQQTSDWRSLSTHEINCRTGAARTIRTRDSGALARDDRTPNEAWEISTPGSNREKMYRTICAFAPPAPPLNTTKAPPATGLPPLSTYASGTPERALLELIRDWAAADWVAAVALQRPDWQVAHSKGGPDEYDNPIPWMKASLGWGRPTKVGQFTREPLSAGIVRLEASLDLLHDGKPDPRTLRCKVYPVGAGWKLDIDHCSMVKR